MSTIIRFNDIELTINKLKFSGLLADSTYFNSLFTQYADWKIYIYKSNNCFYSKSRGIRFILNTTNSVNEFFNKPENKYIIDLLNLLDTYFFKTNSIKNYIDSILDIPSEILENYNYSKTNDDKSNSIIYVFKSKLEYLKTKREFKQLSKSKVNKHFVRGKHYYLRNKTFDGSKTDIKEFICKQFIYTINDVSINCVIMKQILGMNNSIFTLNHEDCKKYHIKYEDGLQVFPMTINWIEKNERYK